MLKIHENLQQIISGNFTAPAEDDKRAFFDAVRGSLFNGKLSQSQVDGLETLLIAVSPFSLPQQAYILATAYHETAHTMQPIAEYGRGRFRPYGSWSTNSKGQLYGWRDSSRNSVYLRAEYPHLYFGRGYVQLTWLSNYLRAGKELGAMLNDAEQLAREPDLALRPDISAAILCLGMQQGWFTGKKLDDYINARQTDYVGARRIVNGTDKAQLIAGYARQFQTALEKIK
ncbi:hypothetical protein [Conchiformibius steedae]|uniref:hypothetical protein n=1 Tax=Conchiformibius steedae TaxID=153493 RepID=UPI0026EA2909|nr:hypothetical protein [Conchiformibius steedae]